MPAYLIAWSGLAGIEGLDEVQLQQSHNALCADSQLLYSLYYW